MIVPCKNYCTLHRERERERERDLFGNVNNEKLEQNNFAMTER